MKKIFLQLYFFGKFFVLKTLDRERDPGLLEMLDPALD